MLLGCRTSPEEKCELQNRKKRVPNPACKTQASLSVEAAIVVPLLLAATVALIYVMNIMQLQMRLQKALYEHVHNVAAYSYYYDSSELELGKYAETLLSDGAIYAAVVNELGEEYLDRSFIVNGHQGLYLNLTGGAKEKLLDVTIEYQVRPPYDLLGIGKMTLVSRAVAKPWIGIKKEKSDEEEDTGVAYVAINGVVYHLDRECTYIRTKTKTSTLTQIGALRNNSGGKYYPCENCCKTTGDISIVYYTTYGTRYHSSVTCQNIKRTVTTMDLEKAKEQYRPCSKCAAG